VWVLGGVAQMRTQMRQIFDRHTHHGTNRRRSNRRSEGRGVLPSRRHRDDGGIEVQCRGGDDRSYPFHDAEAGKPSSNSICAQLQP
jgi:hypothetical protein